MDSIQIQGEVKLQGKVRIQGSKNAALPILAATLLTRDVSYLRNCPKIADVYGMLEMLECLGCSVLREEAGIRVDTSKLRGGILSKRACGKMRSSLCMLGAMLGSIHEARLDYPGGCVIGSRPIDFHIDALKKMGVRFLEKEKGLYAFASNLHGADITLKFPSVGATENIILAAVLAKGNTIIRNAAMEPEVVSLCDYLKQSGADIVGAGKKEIIIRGVDRLTGTDYTIPSDRIVAGTYLFATVGCGGEVYLENAPVKQMEAPICLAKQMGAHCLTLDNGIFLTATGTVNIPDFVMTEPYPGFPTDLQSVALASMTRGKGQGIIEENIFENRFRILEELNKLGTKVKQLDEKHVKVYGVERLNGNRLKADELRGGAALVVAGLMSKGTTVISGCEYIQRGYENICRDLRELGARIASG